MRTDPSSPSDWFLLDDDRLEKTDALHRQFGTSWSGVKLLHGAVERYLKRFLMSKGWQLVKMLDLNRVFPEACAFDERFGEFAQACQNLTGRFWEQHYPGGDLDEVGEEYQEIRGSLHCMIQLIKQIAAI